MSTLNELVDVEKNYIISNQQFNTLNKISLTINNGEILLILGSPSSGKPLSLNQIGGIDRFRMICK